MRTGETAASIVNMDQLDIPGRITLSFTSVSWLFFSPLCLAASLACLVAVDKEGREHRGLAH